MLKIHGFVLNEKSVKLLFQFITQLNNYSIRSNNNSSNNLHMKNWVIEGSDDGKDWIKNDEQNNNYFLNGPHYVHAFTIKRENENKKVKNQTGLNWSQNYFLKICSVENKKVKKKVMFYGTILKHF